VRFALTEKKRRAPFVDRNLPDVTLAVSSSQAPLRHPKLSAYRCFLPDLTGFTGSRRAGPNRQRHLLEAGSTRICLGGEFNPAIAVCGYRDPLPPRLARQIIN